MFSKRVLLILLVALFSMYDAACEEKLPDWLQGKLFISMKGSETMAVDEIEESKYIGIFDFSNRSFTTTKIPTDAMLTEDLAENGDPVIIFRGTNWYDGEDAFASHKWRNYSVATYNYEKGIFEYGVPGEYKDEQYYANCLGRNMIFDAPLQVLQVQGPGTCVYFLEYNVSTQGKLEIQLVCEQSNERIEYASFPLDYSFGIWDYAISRDGVIAWTDFQSIFVSDGIRTIELPESESAYSLCWKDEYNILYFNAKDNMTLTQFNTETLQKETLYNSDGKPFKIDGLVPYVMDTDESGQNLAIYAVNKYMTTETNKIYIFSIENGEEVSFDPWPNTGFREQYKYIISDEGVYLREPGETTDLQMVFISE